MRALVKKAVTFKQRDPQSGRVIRAHTVQGSMAIVDLPDWVKSDPIFGWMKTSGDIVEIETKRQCAELENNPGEPSRNEPSGASTQNQQEPAATGESPKKPGCKSKAQQSAGVEQETEK